MDVEPSEDQDRRQYERDRIAWNLPAPKTSTVVLLDPDEAPHAEAEPSDELEQESAPAA